MPLAYEAVSTVSTGPLRVLKSTTAPHLENSRTNSEMERWLVCADSGLKEEGHHLADKRKFGFLKGRKSGGWGERGSREMVTTSATVCSGARHTVVAFNLAWLCVTRSERCKENPDVSCCFLLCRSQHQGS